MNAGAKVSHTSKPPLSQEDLGAVYEYLTFTSRGTASIFYPGDSKNAHPKMRVQGMKAFSPLESLSAGDTNLVIQLDLAAETACQAFRAVIENLPANDPHQAAKQLTPARDAFFSEIDRINRQFAETILSSLRHHSDGFLCQRFAAFTLFEKTLPTGDEVYRYSLSEVLTVLMEAAESDQLPKGTSSQFKSKLLLAQSLYSGALSFSLVSQPRSGAALRNLLDCLATRLDSEIQGVTKRFHGEAIFNQMAQTTAREALAAVVQQRRLDLIGDSISDLFQVSSRKSLANLFLSEKKVLGQGKATVHPPPPIDPELLKHLRPLIWQTTAEFKALADDPSSIDKREKNIAAIRCKMFKITADYLSGGDPLRLISDQMRNAKLVEYRSGGSYQTFTFGEVVDYLVRQNEKDRKFPSDEFRARKFPSDEFRASLIHGYLEIALSSGELKSDMGLQQGAEYRCMPAVSTHFSEDTESQLRASWLSTPTKLEPVSQMAIDHIRRMDTRNAFADASKVIDIAKQARKNCLNRDATQEQKKAAASALFKSLQAEMPTADPKNIYLSTAFVSSYISLEEFLATEQKQAVLNDPKSAQMSLTVVAKDLSITIKKLEQLGARHSTDEESKNKIQHAISTLKGQKEQALKLRDSSDSTNSANFQHVKSCYASIDEELKGIQRQVKENKSGFSSAARAVIDSIRRLLGLNDKLSLYSRASDAIKSMENRGVVAKSKVTFFKTCAEQFATGQKALGATHAASPVA